MIDRLILVFNSIHDVLNAEKQLKQRGIGCDLIPTPKEFSSDCGMSIAIQEEDRAAVEALRDELRCRLMQGCPL